MRQAYWLQAATEKRMAEADAKAAEAAKAAEPAVDVVSKPAAQQCLEPAQECLTAFCAKGDVKVNMDGGAMDDDDDMEEI